MCVLTVLWISQAAGEGVQRSGLTAPSEALWCLVSMGKAVGPRPQGREDSFLPSFQVTGGPWRPLDLAQERELCCMLLLLAVPPGPPLRKSGLKALGGGEDEASLLLGLRPCGIMQHGQQGLKVVLTEGCFGGSRRLLLPQTPTQARLSVFLHLCG